MFVNDLYIVEAVAVKFGMIRTFGRIGQKVLT